tara:strand:- start:145 stop:624 length:480 start_codon:yes stop_codon:yes gene_type:complete
MELNLIRQNKIDNLLQKLIENADGKIIVGDGKSLVRESDTIEVINEFTNGVYMRRMDVMKGTLIIGAVHKEKHSWFLMRGVVKVADAGSVSYIEAPYYTLSDPGTQRVIEVVEDAIWVNIHSNPDNGQDIDIIEKRLFSFNMEEYKKHLNNKKEAIWQE